jgi:uncharacterized membrane protein YgcG
MHGNHPPPTGPASRDRVPVVCSGVSRIHYICLIRFGPSFSYELPFWISRGPSPAARCFSGKMGGRFVSFIARRRGYLGWHRGNGPRTGYKKNFWVARRVHFCRVFVFPFILPGIPPPPPPPTSPAPRGSRGRLPFLAWSVRVMGCRLIGRLNVVALALRDGFVLLRDRFPFPTYPTTPPPLFYFSLLPRLCSSVFIVCCLWGEGCLAGGARATCRRPSHLAFVMTRAPAPWPWGWGGRGGRGGGGEGGGSRGGGGGGGGGSVTVPGDFALSNVFGRSSLSALSNAFSCYVVCGFFWPFETSAGRPLR